MADAALLGGRYEILRTVSMGRRAEVLQALDRVHGRLVALKVYPVGESGRDELLAEARVLMSIAPHKGLPAVRGDFFTDDGERYVVVMNWIDGTDLQQVLDDDGSPGLLLDDVLADLAQVADALDHLHRHDPPIVHGDVKPDNIIRTGDRRVVLVDFDIAGAQAGDRLGTLGYVAPEVAMGDKPTPAADVFGLAATAVALLNGRTATDATPTYPGLDHAEQAEIGRALRAALATDPARRPKSAGNLIEKLRSAARAVHPTGVVALLALEVADAGRLWEQDAEEMRSAMSRLGDVRNEVVAASGGRIVSTMNEADRTIAVFREASAAAVAATTLHQRVADEKLPPGFEVRLRAALAIGEANVVDGVYTGAVVDRVVRLRAAAEPGTTVTTESTAELLVGLVGKGMSIVPLGSVVTADFPNGTALFALTRPGEGAMAGSRSRESGTAAVSPPNAAASRPDDQIRGTAALAVDVLQGSLSLTALTALGLATIFRLVLATELDVSEIGNALVSLAASAFAVTFVLQLRRARGRAQAARAERVSADAAAAREHDLVQDRLRTRRRLEQDFTSAASEEARSGAAVVVALAEEYDAVAELISRTTQRPVANLAALVPGLAEETYRHGMSALSDALELFASADGPQRRRLRDELAEIEQRLERDVYPDNRVRTRDEDRRTSHLQLLVRQDASRHRACDLLYEAERCTAALAEVRLELGSMRAGDTQVDADAVVRTLQDTIRCVRELQDELRELD